MTAKIRVKDNGARRAQQLLRQPRRRLRIGVFGAQAARIHPTNGETVGQVAVWMEHGNETVPARSWLFDWLEENITTITRQLATDTLRVIFGKPPESEKRALEKRGGVYVKLIVNRIHDIPAYWPPLNAVTIRKKGHDLPLVDTETFIDSIRWEVE